MKRDTKKHFDNVSILRAFGGTLELVLLTLAYILVWRRGYDSSLFPPYLGYGKYVLAFVYSILLLTLFAMMDGFAFGYLRMSELCMSQFIVLFLTNFITYWQLCLIANVVITAVPMLVLLAIDALIVLVCTVVFTWVYHHVYAPKKMLMIFGKDEAVSLKFKMETRPDKYRIAKMIPEEEGLESICRQVVNYDAVILNDISAQLRNDILKYCYRNEIRTYVTPKLTDIVIRGADNVNLFDTPLYLVRGERITLSQRIVKRMMDIVISLIGLILTSPIMLLVALAIKIEDAGPVLYKQARVSLNGKVFHILKFRSMVVDAEKDGKSIPATGKDPRITKVGRVIRALRIDELPQLFNILKSDMSVVGPRPERVEHMEKYGKEIPEFSFRTKVKGGLTGFAQVYGKYNTSPYDKLRLDMMYIENYSLLLDIKLILLTIRILFSRESTEGFEKIQENNVKKEKLLQEIREEKEDREEQLTAVGR